MSEPKVDELTLEQKIAHAADPSIKLALARQLIEETKQDLFVNADMWEEEINKIIPQMLAALQISPIKYKCRIFFHLSNERQWRMCDGTIVEIHYYGHGRDKDTHKFKSTLAEALKHVPRLQRSSALELRSIMLERKEGMKFPWQRVKIKDREVMFNLLPKSQITTEYETQVTIIKRHKSTGIKRTVIGLEKDINSLEIQCWLLLSRAVTEHYEGVRDG